MNFIVITKIPDRQGMIGPIRAKNIVEYVEAENLDDLRERLHIPIDSECLVVDAENVTIIKPTIVNKVVI